MSSSDHASASHRTVERTIEKWVSRQLGAIDHERRVAEIAMKLVDVTADRSLLDTRHRRLLAWGAIVHDVGRSVNDDRHPQIGAKLIEAADSLPLNKSDRRALCYLTRYHRGAVPKAGKDDVLKESDDAQQLRIALGYLRAADALDNRNLESPRLAIVAHRDRLHITAHLSEDSAKARRVYRRRRKFKLLEETLGVTVNVDVIESNRLIRTPR